MASVYSQISAGMHINSPFWYKKHKNFLGRGHSPHKSLK